MRQDIKEIHIDTAMSEILERLIFHEMTELREISQLIENFVKPKPGCHLEGNKCQRSKEKSNHHHCVEGI